MYKLKKEYKGQDVTCFFPDGSFVKLEHASDEDFAKVYKVKGYQKFIDIDKRTKAAKEIKEDKK